MNQLPRLAIGVLHASGVDPAVIGDLEEASRAGCSRLWCWRQVIGILFFESFKHVRRHPLDAVLALAIGWFTLFFVFQVLEVGGLFFPLATAYQTGNWMPFYIAASLVAYAGFALSAWSVTLLRRRAAGPLLILHTATVVLAMAVAAVVVEMREPAVTAVPHVFFPLVSVALPYQWRSGFILVPVTMLLTGMLVLRTRRDAHA